MGNLDGTRPSQSRCNIIRTSITDPVTKYVLKPKDKAAIIHGELTKSLDVRQHRYGYPGGENKNAVWDYVLPGSDEAAEFNRRFDIRPKVRKLKQSLGTSAILAASRSSLIVSACYGQDHRALFAGSSGKSFISKNGSSSIAANEWL